MKVTRETAATLAGAANSRRQHRREPQTTSDTLEKRLGSARHALFITAG